jgi:hypothetical protein
MIIENAVITIDPGQAIAFETAVGDCVEIFRAAQGCHGMALLRIVDEPGRYRLIIKCADVLGVARLSSMACTRGRFFHRDAGARI